MPVTFRDSARKNPTLLLAILLIAHMAAVSLNRTPDKANRLFAQVWLMTVLAPFQWATATAVAGVSHVWNHYFDLRDSGFENERLRAERDQIRAELLEAQEEVKQAEQLRALVNWQSPQPYQKVLARVIARDATQWFNTVVIDRGSFSGVSKDQPVITPEGGLAGRVISVAPNAARVLLVTDERHGAGAIIGQLTGSRMLGVVKGKNSSLCEMKFVEVTEKIEPGTTVITSGQDGIYPKGLLIGRVKSIQTGSPEAPSAVVVEPVTPFSKLELVSVLLVSKEQVRASVSELLEVEKEKQGKPPERRRR